MVDREALRQRLLVTFKVEAREHLAVLSDTLLELEREAPGTERAQAIELVFREAHSLKGAARAVSLTRMESVCQALESVFSALKRGTLPITKERLDVLLSAVRVLEQLLSAVEKGEAETRVAIESTVAALLGSLDRADDERPDVVASLPETADGAQAAPDLAPVGLPPFPEEGATSGSQAAQAGDRLASLSTEAVSASIGRISASVDTVRVPTRKLDRVRLHAEELFSERVGLVDQADETLRLHQSVVDFRKRLRKTLRAFKTAAGDRARSLTAAERPTDLIQALEVSSAFLEDLERRSGILGRAAQRNQRSVTSRAEQLLADSLDLLMLPCSWLLDGFAHLVRDLGRNQDKDVALVVQGSAIEVDRRILTELRDPFLHALRNAVDHGIELPAERTARGKPAQGTIAITIEQVPGNRIEIRISDDGRGVDPDKVRSAALRLGLLAEESAAGLDAQALLNLVFQSDLSTSPVITDLSGRGLGLAIFREKVERVGGSVSIASQPLAGTTLRMSLPVSIATFRGVVVQVRGRLFVLPTVSVQRVSSVRPEQIRTLENRAAIELDGQSVALVEMSDALGVSGAPAAKEKEARLPLVIVSASGARIAFVVDEIVGERDALAKSVGPHLRGLPGVLGASLVGAGNLALIIDPHELIRRATALEPAVASSFVRTRDRAETTKHSILVAEDSITSRTLLKSILESAGYAVTTAVDGLDAFEKLRGGHFDLLVSDVDMPRLNGLGLTQRVRADKQLAELPVVLVTSLESREDRERGIDVGANAYLVKQSFDQSNLLGAIQRLL